MAPTRRLVLAAFATWFSVVIADVSIYSNCQHPSTSPQIGCNFHEAKTIGVSSNGCDADFNSIQGAIDSLPHDNSSQTILVLPGNYIEQLNVTRPGPLTLLGETALPNSQENNTVAVYWASADTSGRYTDNVFTSVLTVAPTLNASLTGSGNTGFAVPPDTPFGCSDFRVYNIDFRNVYSDASAGPSLAVSVSRANAGFYHSGFFSFQDSVYVGHLGNAYFYRNTIAGQTDFFYGFGTAWVEQSQIQLRGCGGGIIAWKGTNTTFTNKYGCYISNSHITAANSSIAPNIVGKCFLGRPWNAQHRSVYLNTYMDASIQGAGYERWSNNPSTWNWNNYTVMAEYDSYGPGFNLTKRIAGNLTIEFNKTQAEVYGSPKQVFMTPDGLQPDIAWLDTDVE